MKIFINDAQKNAYLQNINADLKLVLNEFKEISKCEGSFFGIEAEDKIIQFAWETPGKWLVDIPYDMKNRISLQRYANDEECINIIKSIFSGTSPDTIEGLIKVDIMKSNLNDCTFEK